MFSKTHIKCPDNIFEQLSKSVEFEDICKGRIGTNIVLIDKHNRIPIVRTTTKYTKPAHNFTKLHSDLVNRIKQITGISFLNNAMIEIYDHNYKTMGYHCDQAQDLDPDSYIVIYSCYNNPDTKDLRKLKIKHKENKDESFEIIMDHNSVLYFSVSTNSLYLHKIVLEMEKGRREEFDIDTKWLGITLRVSKTYIKFIDNMAYFNNNKQLRLLNDSEDKEKMKKYYKLRGMENRNIIFEYPDLDYTISSSDLMIPI